jgi:FixJ family two-component response regulator
MQGKSVGQSPTVYIVDDDPAVQQALRLLFRSAGYRAELFSSAVQFLEAYHRNMTGCILLDVRMPGMSGLELQEALNARLSLLPVIFMTGHGDVPMAVAAMQSGAIDFIQKPFDDQELLNRVAQALSQDAHTRGVLEEKHEIRKRLESLTPREREIMDMVVNGMANKVIAGDLKLSQRTVEIHRARVMEKMSASSLAHLVRMVIAVTDLDITMPNIARLTRA